MLQTEFAKVYAKFRMHFYRQIFQQVKERDGSLSATEAFSVEVIYLLGSPTIREFAEYIDISQPNATYKVNNLIKKGYIKKNNSASDKREYHLEVTDKFLNYYGVNDAYFQKIMDRIEQCYTPEQVALLSDMMRRITQEIGKDE